MKKMMFMALLLSSTLAAKAQVEVPIYQNPSYSAEQRAEDLLGRLTLEQKVKLMMSDSEAVPEVGIHNFNWWSEALHGSARSGNGTVFPQAIGMAASWDPVLLEKVFDIASTEQRIKYIQARKKGDVTRYSGLAVWTPNINIFRDPRWGRGQETYGEDPYLTTVMGKSVVIGLQGETKHPHLDIQSPYDKLHACLKHYAVHSGPEYERHGFDAHDISMRDLQETYLYAFERLVKTTDVKEVMCAYNAFEGEPCCGSDNLLTQILRNEWGYQGLVVSDCGAIRDFFDGRPGYHNLFPDGATASANAVLSGTDINCGSSYKHLPKAVKRGAIKESDIDVSVRRLLKARFEMGDMDPMELDPWNTIPVSELCSEYNGSVALDMARKSMTLLQNKGVLPLSQRKNGRPLKVAVIGPNANDSLTQWGNYYGTPLRTITVLDAIQKKLGKENVYYNKVSEWAVGEVFKSLYSQCEFDGKQGMRAQYWNNKTQEGEPVAVDQLTAPFQKCTAGNTVFYPGVNLEDFSAKFETTYHAKSSEKVIFDYFVCGNGEFIVTQNGDTILNAEYHTGHGPRHQQKEFQAEAGKDYEICINYAFSIPDAQFNLDFGVQAKTDIPQLLSETKDVDCYIFVGGISPFLEGEEMKVYFDGFKGGDRTSIQLPKIQRETIAALHKTGKPVVYVNMSGSAIGMDPEKQICDAILQAWYPGQAGGQAVCDVLFGDYNPAGRLPITFYKDVNDLPDYHDYNMPGHTYRYYQGTPTFAFGEGLSYSKFEYGEAQFMKVTKKVTEKDAAKPNGTTTITTFKVTNKISRKEEGELVVPVTNTSHRDGEEVVQVYLKRVGEKDGPQLSLRGFKRISIKAGETINVSIPMDEFNFRTYNPASGKMEMQKGEYILYYGKSSKLSDLKELKVTVK